MRILIVGGGVAGLAMARALRRVGLASEIVERADAWRIESAGVYVPGNGMRALQRLGLADDVAAAGDVVDVRRLRDDRGRLLIEFDEAGFWRPVALPIALPRRELHRILADGASDTPIRSASPSSPSSTMATRSMSASRTARAGRTTSSSARTGSTRRSGGSCSAARKRDSWAR